MTNPCKYVMIDHVEPVIFRKPLHHADMKRLMMKITSAGFFLQDSNGKVIVPPVESTTLGLGPAPEDAAIIEAFLKGE